MKTSLNNGQITFHFFNAHIGKNDCISGHETGLRIQLYWPQIKIFHNRQIRNHRELFISFHTVLRVVTESDGASNYSGFGIQILGFGFAADYQSK